MKSGKKKNYSTAEKVAYHKARVQSSNVKKTQKMYSRNFLYGVLNEHAKNDLKEAKSEFLKRDRVNVTSLSVDRAIYGGYINGMKARLQNEDKGGK